MSAPHGLGARLRPDVRHVRYLVALGADREPHSRRTFLDHLKGTFYLLGEWGNREQVCVAGLFHSAYGTPEFERALLPGGARDELRAAIGEEAERLAYLFCTMHRGKFLARIGSCELEHHATGERSAITPLEERDLCEILFANKLEQHPRFGCSSEDLVRIARVFECIESRLTRAACSHYADRYRHNTRVVNPPPPPFDLGRLLEPLDVDEFRRTHWEKSYVHIEGSPERFASLFSWDELNAFLRHHRVEKRDAPRLRVYGGGSDGDVLQPATAKQAELRRISHRVDSRKLHEHLLGGGNLQIYELNELNEPLASLAQSMTGYFGRDVSVYLFASVCSSLQGLPIHFDYHDLFVVQLDGSKDWSLYEPTEQNPVRTAARDRDARLTTAALADPESASSHFREKARRVEESLVWTGRLRPGDVLYVPCGWYHRVSPTHERSLHLSIPVEPSNALTLLADMIAEELADDSFFRESLPWFEDGARRTSYAEALRRRLAERIDAPALDRFFSRTVEQRDLLPRFSLPDACEPVSLTDEPRMRFAWAAERVRMRVDRAAELLSIEVGGRVIELQGAPETALRLLERIEEQRELTLLDVYAIADELGVYRDDVRAILGHLVRSAVLRVGDSG